ncbi:hypothetical protein H0E87_024641 [Populus deltoides]|uniref:Uncharacterized protein n=1 Tax=Populus deltoides TaxID=3696 RepID=A0A8T2X8X8_POPDE|nr:hypothetical protein H0E87_024641 [Populus deltoides]
MAGQAADSINQGLRVKATLKLGSELYAVNSCNGNTISNQLVSMKEQSMSILKEFITKHNVPHDVPDELAESSSEDEVLEKPQGWPASIGVQGSITLVMTFDSPEAEQSNKDIYRQAKAVTFPINFVLSSSNLLQKCFKI